MTTLLIVGNSEIQSLNDGGTVKEGWHENFQDQAGMCRTVGAGAQHSGTSPSNHTREGMLAPLAELGLSVPGEPPSFNQPLHKSSRIMSARR